jgi:hypothetical protein
MNVLYGRSLLASMITVLVFCLFLAACLLLLVQRSLCMEHGYDICNRACKDAS